MKIDTSVPLSSFHHTPLTGIIRFEFFRSLPHPQFPQFELNPWNNTLQISLSYKHIEDSPLVGVIFIDPAAEIHHLNLQ